VLGREDELHHYKNITMQELFDSFPFIPFFIYSLSWSVIWSILILKTFPVDISPKWINKDISFMLMLLIEVPFLYFAYTLFTIPVFGIWKAILVIVVARWIVKFVSKMIGLVRYTKFLQGKLKSTPQDSEDYEWFSYQFDLIQKDERQFLELCKQKKNWKIHD
jgi:hypothetical protein